MTFLKLASRETAAQDLLWRIVAVRELVNDKSSSDEARKALAAELERLLSEYSILCDLRSPITVEVEDLVAKVNHVYSMSIQPRPLYSTKGQPGLLRSFLIKCGLK